MLKGSECSFGALNRRVDPQKTVNLGQLKECEDAGRRPDYGHFAAVLLGADKKVDQEAKSGGIHVRNLTDVEDQVGRSDVLEGPLELEHVAQRERT